MWNNSRKQHIIGLHKLFRRSDLGAVKNLGFAVVKRRDAVEVEALIRIL
jgi:hypothetical protein